MLLALLPSLSLSPAGRQQAAASFDAFSREVRAMQERMIRAAKHADPAASWTVDEHARGRAVIVEDGEVWEKGCISVTVIEDGELSAVRAATISGRTGVTIEEGARYSACALSFVLHSLSPLVPTLRGDVRVFVVGDDQWYGGGLDLTPSYVEPDDCEHFHSKLSELCDQHGTSNTYAEMKAACDSYFFLPARKEHRGVGGIFFDDLKAEWAPGFARAIIAAALDEDGPYMPIVRRRAALQFTEAQKQWQVRRRMEHPCMSTPSDSPG